MVKFDSQKPFDKAQDRHHRRSIRLKGYDYSQEGAYFVTIVTWHRECLFGKIINGEIRLNKLGKIVEWEWLDLPKRLSYVELGAYAVMPNHFHGIVFLREHVGATLHDPTRSRLETKPLPTISRESVKGSPLPNGPKPASLGGILAQFKS